MSEYIKRDDAAEQAIAELEEICVTSPEVKAKVRSDYEQVPAVEVVHCRDCVKRGNICPLQIWCGPDDDDFCSKGERAEE